MGGVSCGGELSDENTAPVDGSPHTVAEGPPSGYHVLDWDSTGCWRCRRCDKKVRSYKTRFMATKCYGDGEGGERRDDSTTATEEEVLDEPLDVRLEVNPDIPGNVAPVAKYASPKRDVEKNPRADANLGFLKSAAGCESELPVSRALPRNGPKGIFDMCCAGYALPIEEQKRSIAADGEEIIDANSLKLAACANLKATTPEVKALANVSIDSEALKQTCVAPEPPKKSWRRPILFGIFMISVVVMSAFIQGWLDAMDGSECVCTPTLGSVLRYGTIPVIAAIIGYGTNVVALQMMFYPVKFVGFFPHLKIGLGLDIPLFGWQGVIPMKAKEMAEISVDLMTQKLIKVEEVFDRLDPVAVGNELGDLLPEVVSSVMNEAGRKNCPKLWEHLPAAAREQLEMAVVAESKSMMAGFIRDLQRNIANVFDLKDAVVDFLVKHPESLNEMFMTCGAEEFEFIRISGFYLGFFFGLIQMAVWMFIKQWWILPICGIFVGYFTNVIALKIIFAPVEPKVIRFCCWKWTVQGLFLIRQNEVSDSYGKMTAELVLSADNLMYALANGPKSEEMYRLVDKHVAKCMEDQASYYKNLFLLSIGAETWIDFRTGVCTEFRKKMPLLLARISGYTQRTLDMEATLTSRLKKLSSPEFERLLHAVFEQDEIKLILVGAILGAIVGFFQAVAQTPEQLGLTDLF